MAEILAETQPDRTAVTAAQAEPIPWPPGTVVRDIARGGFAGILVGVFVAGLGGRLVMRLATILHEDTVGRLTEANEVIGRISFNGTMALITFGGLGMGLMAGVIWVIVGPWMPGKGLLRALIAGLAAVALGTPSLVQRFNPDFTILKHDPAVVALLLGLVFSVGFAMAMVDGSLDRRLPPASSNAGKATGVYVMVTLLGLVLILPLVVAGLLNEPDYRATVRMGWGLAVVGICTLVSWRFRTQRRPDRPRGLLVLARGALLVTIVLGVVTSLPHVLAAVGVP